jgi:tRNA dimethylallyltransferase
LAQKFRGEIVNADSRQVYRLMDIGTAKPTLRDMALAPHHLFDIIFPDEEFSLAQYREMALKTISDIHSRGAVPFLIGGSGQYIWAMLEGWTIPRIPPDPALRQQLENEALEKGIDGLYQRLQELDPAAAGKIDKRNVRRVIRALEVSLVSGQPVSSLRIKQVPEYDTLIIGLTAPREELYRRIDARVDEMIEAGLMAETQKLMDKGYGFNLPSLSSIGYQQMGSVLKGEADRDEAISQFKNANHRFVRHQYAWFKLGDPRIHWFDVCADFESAAVELVSNWLH